MEYEDTLKKAKDTCLKLLDDKNGWQTVGDTKEPWVIEKKPSDELKLSVFRVTVSINAPVEVVRDTISFLPWHRELDWDKAIKEKSVIKKISDNTVLYATRTHAVARGIISAREFVDVGREEEIEGGFLLYGMGVEYGPLDCAGSHVRAMNHGVGIRVVKDPQKPGHTLLTAFSQADLKGMIPRAVVDSTLPGVISQTYHDYFKFLQTEGHPVSLK